MTASQEEALVNLACVLVICGFIALLIAYPIVVQVALAVAMVVMVCCILAGGIGWLLANIWALFTGRYPRWWS